MLILGLLIIGICVIPALLKGEWGVVAPFALIGGVLLIAYWL